MVFLHNCIWMSISKTGLQLLVEKVFPEIVMSNLMPLKK